MVRTHILRFRCWPFRAAGLVLDKSSNMVARYREIALRTRGAFYTVSFDPPHAAQPDEYHDLKVQIERAWILCAHEHRLLRSAGFLRSASRSLPDESLFRNWSRSWMRPTRSMTASWPSELTGLELTRTSEQQPALTVDGSSARQKVEGGTGCSGR